MILFFVTLLFGNIGFGATSHIQTSPVCASLILKAGLFSNDELTSESATEIYIQYLKYFVDKGNLNLDDLKIIRGFSSVPHITELFAGKIETAFVYDADIQRLLSFVDKIKLDHTLDEIIKKLSKDEFFRNVAHEDTKLVTVWFTQLNPYYHKEIISHKYADLLPDGPYLIDKVKELVWNLDTAKSFKIKSEAHQLKEISSVIVDKKMYFLNQAGIEIQLYDPDTGTMLLEGHSDRKPGILRDANGNFKMVWGKLSSKDKNYKLHFYIQGAGDESPIISSWYLPINYSPETKWLNEENGTLIGYCHYLNGGENIRILEANSDEVKYFDIPAKYLGDYHLSTFDRVDSNHFTLLVEARAERKLKRLEMTRPNGQSQWEVSESEILGKYPNYSFVSARMPAGGIMHIGYEFNGAPVIIIKPGENTAHPLDVSHYKKVLYKPDGTPLLLSLQYWEANTYHLTFLDLVTFDENTVTVTNNANLISSSEIFRVMPDGRIVMYDPVLDAVSGDPDIFRILLYQLYGPMNPKTGEVVP